MDQKIRTASGYFITYVLLCCGAGMGVFGITMLQDPAKEARFIAMLGILSSVLMIAGGISSLRSTRRAGKTAAKEMQQVAAMLRQPGTVDEVEPSSSKPRTEVFASVEKPTILAHWQFTSSQWLSFMANEKKERKKSNGIEAIIIAGFGGVIYLFNQTPDSLIVFIIALMVAAIYWVGKYYLAMKSIGEGKKQNDVIITEHAVIINGKFNSFRDEIYWLQKVEVRQNILAIEYGWQTRHGNTFEEIRIPIPQGRIEEAETVKQKLIAASVAAVR